MVSESKPGDATPADPLLVMELLVAGGMVAQQKVDEAIAIANGLPSPVLTIGAKPLQWCAWDRDRCTVTLTFDTDAEVGAFVATHASRQSIAAQVDDDDTWIPSPPLRAGTYRVRGFNLDRDEDDQCQALVDVKHCPKRGVLVSNLHEVNSDDRITEWRKVDGLTTDIEWQRIGAATPTSKDHK